MKKLVLGMESILYTAFLAVLASGSLTGALADLPFAGALAAIPGTLALAVTLGLIALHTSAALSYRLTAGLALLAAAATQLSMPVGAIGPPLVGHPARILGLAVVAVAAAWGSGLYWLVAVAVLLMGEIGGAVAAAVADKSIVGADGFLLLFGQKAENMWPYLLGLAGVGLVTQLTAGGRSRSIQRLLGSTGRAGGEHEGNRTSRIMVPAKDRDNDEPPDVGKTQSFTIDYISELRQADQSNLTDLLGSVVYFMSRNFRSYSSLGFVFDPVARVFVLNSYHSKSGTVADGVSIPLGKGVVGDIGVKGHSFMSGDLTLYDNQLFYYSGTVLINSVLAVPIVSQKRELLGALVIDSKDKNAFSDRDKEILHRFSHLAAALITNARMRFHQEQVARRFQIFYEMSQQLTTTLKVTEVLEVLSQMASQMVPATRIMAITFDAHSRKGVVQKIKGSSPDIAEGYQFGINSGLYSFAFQKRQTVNIPDFGQYGSRYYRFVPDESREYAPASLIILPLADDEARCLGLLSLESDRRSQFGGEIEPILSTLVANASVGLNRAVLYQQMELLATTDGLTGLNNHRHFQELLAAEIERSDRYGRPVSLILMDIDHFKSFNDTYGHPVGDLVLKEISACIRRSIRRTDTPARYGGEEFVVIMPETDERNAPTTPERIRHNIENHIIESMGRQLRVTVSLGCATYPTKAGSQQELIDNADKALYYSKEHGRNRVTLFAPGMQKEEEGG